ncbi:histidinol dehydrogenase [Flammeovirga kamogawensis]|uniref:Histidinol dehydrogenase n=1 Tax=Flammeovirga kamogawensis TaxID=373891 RepID=A0ABX8GX30_9BACT|nr:histidinol dehydrogenase [Flammeovirga kamogawensis]MBB6460519.1 histidinol dehydrogenase [Flammeovirga kamogawensis]QWG07883.1 histidinol dehydrogenase [Flammeovirga kamogawensis]TRX69688.1 histidinol dehydrogenase [Flammeovirga kamogawensis]
MKLYKYPAVEDWKKLLQRPSMRMEDIEKQVTPILKTVQKDGDAALKAFSLRFDGANIDSILVSEEEFSQAEKDVDNDLKESISIAIKNVTKFHSAQKTDVLKVETMPGISCWRKSVPIQKVGLYIPGGSAPLFSTVIMIGAPALIAGCEEVFLCTPPNSEGKVHPAILYAAKKIGLTKVYKVGGAQAIAAMTFGTETIPSVSKIFGPGNQYVTAAKQLATKEGVAIDMPAGPSEVLVWADETANPTFIAADLLSQAEHGPDSQVILVSTSEDIIQKTEAEVEKQLSVLPRKEIAAKALEHSRSFLMKDEAEALKLVNEYAAEHLILSLDNAEDVAEKIINAGSVFVGHYTPESAGDYASGTNHTLPTYGYAKNYSGVSLDSYYRKITFQKIEKEGLESLGPHVERMAAAEELDAHKNAVTVRLNALKD